MPQEQTKHEARNYHRTQMKRELIIQKLREQGCRITRQRRILLDIILEEECSCCKEIYYKALQKDSSIGPATVYRMVNTLESIGAISRKNFYKIACGEECEAFMAGIGYGINLEYEIMYDKFNRYICILPLARKSLPDEYYRIAGNIFVALNDSVIEGILIKL